MAGSGFGSIPGAGSCSAGNTYYRGVYLTQAAADIAVGFPAVAVPPLGYWTARLTDGTELYAQPGDTTWTVSTTGGGGGPQLEEVGQGSTLPATLPATGEQELFRISGSTNPAVPDGLYQWNPQTNTYVQV